MTYNSFYYGSGYKSVYGASSLFLSSIVITVTIIKMISSSAIFLCISSVFFYFGKVE